MTAVSVRQLRVEAERALESCVVSTPSPPTPSGERREVRGQIDTHREAEALLLHALGCTRAWLYAHADDAVAPALAGQVRCCVSRRASGEPVAYIVGQRGFHAIDLALTPDVLIPRPETELLVELALQRIGSDEKAEIADLGTGSGAIALAIAQARPRSRVLATDASAAALDVARGNARRLRIGHVEFAQGDWCAALGARRFDIIVSNPPYIAEGDAHLRKAICASSRVRRSCPARMAWTRSARLWAMRRGT